MMEINKFETLIQKIGVHYINSKFEGISYEDIFKIPVLALFFTGSWCPPCEEFGNELVSFYNEANQKEKHFEVIQISNEKSENSFRSIIETKPWVFIPYGHEIIKEIVDGYKVEFLPYFLIVNKEAGVASDRGRKDIFDATMTPKLLIDKWKAEIRKSLEKPQETS